MKYSNEWLIAAHNAGEKTNFLFFWGHQSAKDGTITSSCFSQWWQAPFSVADVVYRTAEHWMMAEKARLFNDTMVANQIIEAKTPAEAKKLGRNVRNFDTVVWDAHKFEIVVTGNRYKFSQHEPLKEFLAGTKKQVLVEASPVDAIWGIGMAVDHPMIEDPLKWRGENLLGYALMTVRDQFPRE